MGAQDELTAPNTTTSGAQTDGAEIKSDCSSVEQGKKGGGGWGGVKC